MQGQTSAEAVLCTRPTTAHQAGLLTELPVVSPKLSQGDTPADARRLLRGLCVSPVSVNRCDLTCSNFAPAHSQA